MKKLHFILLIFLSIFLANCASTEQTTKENENQNEVYVFDDADIDSTIPPPPSTPVVEEPVVLEEKVQIDSAHSVDMERNFIVQVGAFTSEERAKKFIAENGSKIEYPLNYRFSAKVNLYVVQLTPFNTRAEAEKVRDKLWTITEFKDAFIVP